MIKKRKFNKKNCIEFSIFSFLTLIFLLSCRQSAGYLNIDAENIAPLTKKPFGWIYSFNKEQEIAYHVGLDSIIKQKGKYSFSIKNINASFNFGVIDYPISKTFEGRSIELKGYIKTHNVNSGYAGLWLRIDGVEKGIAFDNMHKKGVKGTTDWKQYAIKLPYNSDLARTIHIGGLLAGNGTAWFDNFKLFIDDIPIEKVKLLPSKKAATDTAYSKGSGIKIMKLTPQRCTNLVVAGQFWAFLKYHHPAIAKGEYNWDAELFRFLPKVINSRDNFELSKTLEDYLDLLPKPPKNDERPDTAVANIALNPNYGVLFNDSVLSEPIIKKLLFIKNNIGIKEHYYISFTPGSGNPIFRNEKPYESTTYPDCGYRLLSLYRYWAIINYFYPYKNVVGKDWNTVLNDFLPIFINAKDKYEYTIAVLKLIGSIHDTHASIVGNNITLNEIKGQFTVPFIADFVENKLVVTGYYLDTLNVKSKFKIGDLILNINGQETSQLIKKFLPLTPGSNFDTQLRDLPKSYLLRSNKNSFDITLKRQGKLIKESINSVDKSYINKKYEYPGKTSYKLLNNDIGYIFPGKYKGSDLYSIAKLFKSTKGIIIDMRCYPSSFMPYTFGAYLKSFSSPFARMSSPVNYVPGLFQYSSPINNGQMGINVYNGKVVIIVNAESQSQAEFTTMALQSADNVKVLGSTTAGADGNVSPIILPGGIRTMISGLGVFYPDGTPTQRIGIKIDYKIRPSISGIVAGRDELLEKAKQLILAN